MTIFIVDDQNLFREALLKLLKLMIPSSTLYESDNGDDALKMIPKINPDVVLLDVNMPRINGLSVVDQVRKSYPAQKVIILTDVGGESMIVSLIMAKVQGFLFKCVSAEEIRICIETVAAGNEYFCHGAERIFHEKTNQLIDLPQVRFTSRETDILLMIDNGKTIKEMSASLGLSERTITSYREDLFRKTKTKSAPELIAFAYKNGIISPAFSN